ncbi:hypothetical protein GCM10009113_11850 [Marinobacter szutsaonensis]
MSFIPSIATVTDQCLMIFSLSDMLIRQRRSEDSFRQFQYVADVIDNRASVLLAEYMLEMAAKLRFLDDREELLKRYERHQVRVKNYQGVEEISLRDIRWALNKLIHQSRISFSVKKQDTIVLPSPPESKGRELDKPVGLYKDKVVMVLVEGRHNGRAWKHEFSLAQLLNEILRIVFLKNLDESGPHS